MLFYRCMSWALPSQVAPERESTHSRHSSLTCSRRQEKRNYSLSCVSDLANARMVGMADQIPAWGAIAAGAMAQEYIPHRVADSTSCPDPRENINEQFVRDFEVMYKESHEGVDMLRAQRMQAESSIFCASAAVWSMRSHRWQRK